MCLLAVAFHVDPHRPLLVAANRDEFLERTAEPLHVWPDRPDILAGRDVRAGGTWMGVCQSGANKGRWAALTNLRRPDGRAESARYSRGELVIQALSEALPLPALADQLQRESGAYNGFNLLLGDSEHLICLSNAMGEWRFLAPGVHAVSNGLPDDDWPKVRSARRKIRDWAGAPGRVKDLAGLLNDRRPADTGDLPDTGLPPEREKALSSEFIALPHYGTRTCTGLQIDRSGTLELFERSVAGEGNRPGDERTERIAGFWPTNPGPKGEAE